MRNFRNNRQPSVGTKMRRKIINSLQLPPEIGRDRAAYMAGGPPNCFICSKAPVGEAAAKPSYTKLTQDESAKFCSHLGIPVNFFARKLSLFEICPPCYEKIKRMKTILTSPEARANFQAYKEELKSLRSFFEGEFNRFYVPLDLEELKTSIRCVIGLCFFGPFLRRLIAEEMKSPKSPAELQFLEKISTHKLLTPKPIEPTPPPAAIVRPRCFICCQQGVGFSRNSGLVRLSPLESHSLTQLLEFTEPTAESLLNAQVCSSCHERIKLVPGLYQQLELITMELAGAHQYVHDELLKPQLCEPSTACPDFLRIRKQAKNELMASQSMINDSGDVDPPESPEQPMDSLETCWDECYEWDEAAPDLLEDGSEVEPLSSSPVTPSDPPFFSSSIVETDPSSLPADYPSLIHQCNVCSKKFAFADLLMLHEKFQHRRNEYGFLVWERQAKPEYTCEYCDCVFKTLQLLWKHRKIHTGDWPFICGVCGKGFTDKTKWRQHVLLHQGIKEVECPICHKLFSSRRIMRVHQAKHAGVRTHHCTSCDKSYVSAAALQKHVEAIHGNEKYFCDICGKQLPSKHYLYVHARTHKEKETGFLTPTSSTESNQSVPMRVLNGT